MTDLTEQYKKGELPEGVYYVTYYKNDTPEVDIYRRVYSLYEDSKVRFTIEQINEVLGQVPTYEEYKALLKDKELWIKRCNNARNHQFNAMKEAKTLAQTLLKVSPEHREWLETNFKEYL